MRQTRTWELLAGGGKWHWILQLYSWPYYAMIIAGLVLAGFSAFLEKTERSSVFSVSRLTLLGIFLFLSIWECNSRYLVCFIPVMILTASDRLTQGWKLLAGRKKDRKRRANRCLQQNRKA